jgi:hypothetical protein
MNRRSDRLTALLIDAAIHAAASHGPVSAAQELVDAGLTWQVIMRVLNRPNERRTYPGPTSCGTSSSVRNQPHARATDGLSS